MTRLLKTAALSAGLSVLLAFAGHAATLKFNGTVADGGSAGVPIGATYSESGFTMTALSGVINFIDNDFVPSVTPTLGLFDDDVVEFDATGSGVSFVADGGLAFNALQVAVASINSAYGNAQFTFTGNIEGGGIVT